MKDIRISRSYAIVLSCMLFGSPLLVTAEESGAAETQISQNQSNLYICFDENISNIARVVYEISALDADVDSPINLLKRHLDNGFLLGLHDEVLQVLEYADWFVGQLPEGEKKQQIAAKLDQIIEQTLSGVLTMDEDAVMRSHNLRLLTVNERMTVQGKTIFKSDVIIDKKLRVHGKARFYRDVQFKKNVEIDGTLSVVDQVVGCDLTVGCNINMVNSTDAAHGNINKGGERFVHNFGTENTFVGVDAGNFTMTGSGQNTGIGFDALAANTSGSANTAVGSLALSSNTAGTTNVAIGGSALLTNTTGSNNIAVGASALQNNVTGSQNVALGTQALEDNLVNANVAIGYQALTNNTTGVENTAVGTTALANNTTGIANTAVGFLALSSNTSGNNNTAVGDRALFASTIGINNIAMGGSALLTNTTGSNNIAVGPSALQDNVTGSQNIALGTQALENNLVDSNIAIGYQTLMNNTTGSDNTAVGTVSLNSNTTGANNTAVGRSALNGNTIGINNVAVGSLALHAIAVGNHNTAIGVNTGPSTGVIADSSSIYIGESAGSAITSLSTTSNIMIGNSGSALDIAVTRIGSQGTQGKCFIAGIRGITTDLADAIPVLISSNGQLGTVSSSARFKHSIKKLIDESAAILKLNPVSFVYNSDASQTRQFGLIAEEVDAVFPRLVVKDENGMPFTVRYEVLPVLLLNELKKVVSKVDTMEEALALVQQKLAEYTTRS